MQAESEALAIPEMEELSRRPEWQLACRVAASKGLSKSQRLPKFLLYICERHLLGRSSEITEQRIGIEIFHRSTGYNPGEDNIVRSYARLLRKRLDLYFKGEGSRETIRIVIPRGGYVPIFEPSPIVPAAISSRLPRRGLSEVEVVLRDVAVLGGPEHAIEPEERVRLEPVTERDVPPISRGKQRGIAYWLSAWRSTCRSVPARFSGLLGPAGGMVLASVCWLGFSAVQKARRTETPSHLVWAQLFQPDRNTLIVPSDSGLGILQNLSRHLVSVEEYANGSYLSEMTFQPGFDPRNLNDLSRERYTSVVSLNITLQLSRLPELIPDRTQIRYARNITAEDIEHSNVILIGSKHTNPWVSLFENRLAFRLEYTPEVDESYVVNEHPIGAEQTVYRNSAGTISNRTYGTIAYLPGLDGTSHVLIVQGLNMAATQAAADMLFKAHGIEQVLQQAKLPGGALRSFELLVETTSVGATAPTAEILAARIYPQ